MARVNMKALIACALASAAPCALADFVEDIMGVSVDTCNSEGYVCEIPTPPLITSAEYNAADIPWTDVIQTIKSICAVEPRFCSFCMRSFFHDAASYPAFRSTAADASIIASDVETFLEDNTAAGFTPYARTILAHIGNYFQTSASDLLTICAAYTPIALGADQSEDPAFDNLARHPLMVGRIDSTEDVSVSKAQQIHEHIPGEFDATPRLMTFFRDLDRQIDAPPGAEQPDSWDFATRDLVALMGAHTLMDNFGCQEDGCGGGKKTFLWDSAWYADLNSGSCAPRKAPELNELNAPTSFDGAKGRTPDASERRAMRVCGFKSSGGLELADNLQCQIDTLRGVPEDPTIQAGASFQFVDWRPTDSRSACCGDPTCDACSGDDTTWWCEGSEADTFFWPYTWADCELAFAIAEEKSGRGYCPGREGVQYAHEVDCGEMSSDGASLLNSFFNTGGDDSGPAMELFEADVDEWTHYFNKGINKLSALGASWSSNALILQPMVKCSLGTLCPGEMMPVPSGLCPPLEAIFTAAQSA